MEQNKHSELKQRRHGLYGQLIVDKTIKNTYWVKVSLRNGYRKTVLCRRNLDSDLTPDPTTQLEQRGKSKT